MDVQKLRPRMRVEVDVGRGPSPWHPAVVIECIGNEAFIVNASSQHHELIAVSIVPLEFNDKSSFVDLKFWKASFFYQRNHGPYRAHQIRPDRGLCPFKLFRELQIMTRPFVDEWRRQQAGSSPPQPE
jgi:hypothetical protein